MLNTNTISQCTKHKKLTNLVVLYQNFCTLSCPECYNQSQPRQKASELQMRKDIFICEESRLFFKQWTMAVVDLLKQILTGKESVNSVIKFVPITRDNQDQSPIVISIEQASRIMNIVLQEQIAVFQGNLAYVSNQPLQQLTHHIFLMDLYNMVMFPPSKTLELILDKFKKTCHAYYNILRMPFLDQQIQLLQFSPNFIDKLNQITKDKTKKYSSSFLLDSNLLANKSSKSSQQEIKQPAQIASKQIQAISQQEVESETESMKISEIIEKRIIMGHDKRKFSQPIPQLSQFRTPKKEPKFTLPEETVQKQLSIQLHLNKVPQTPSNIRQLQSFNFLEKQLQTQASLKVNAIVQSLQKENRIFKGLKQELDDQIENITIKLGQISAITQASKGNLKNIEIPVKQVISDEVEQLRKKLNKKQQEIDQYRRQIGQKNQVCRQLQLEIQKIKMLENQQVQSVIKHTYQIQAQNKVNETKMDELIAKNAQLIQQLDILQTKNRELEISKKQSQNNSKEREMKFYSQINELNNINQEFIKLVNHKNQVIEQMASKHEDDIRQVKEKTAKQYQILRLLEQQELNAAKKLILDLQNIVKQNQVQFQLIFEHKNAQKLQLYAEFNRKEEQLQKDFSTLFEKTQNYESLLEKLVSKVEQKQTALEQVSKKITELSEVHEKEKAANKGPVQNNDEIKPDKREKIDSQANQILWNMVIEQLHSNIEDLTKKYSNLEEQLVRKDKSFEELNRSLQEQRLLCQSSMKQSSRLNQQILKLLEKIKGLEADVKAKEQKLIVSHQQWQEIDNYVKFLEQKKLEEQKIKESFEFQINKCNQLQEINNHLSNLDKQKQEEIQILKQNLKTQQELIMLKSNEIKNLQQRNLLNQENIKQIGKQKEQLEQTNKILNEDFDKLYQQHCQLKQYVEHLNQQLSQIKQVEIMRDEDESNTYEKYERQNRLWLEWKSRLELRIAELEEKIVSLEQELSEQIKYNDQLLQQVINAESEQKAKSLQIEKLLGLYYELVAQLEEPKRKKYIEAVSRYKPTRVKTQ